MSDPVYDEVPATTVTISADEADDPEAMEELKAALVKAAQKAAQEGRVNSFLVNVVP